MMNDMSSRKSAAVAPLFRVFDPPDDAGPSGRVRLGTLLNLRWLAVSGQSVAVLIVHFGFGYHMPIGLCLLAILASVSLNLTLSWVYPAGRRVPDSEALLHLSYDVLQLSTMLYLTGGIENPFALMFLAPVVISAASLSLRHTLALGGLALVCISFLALFHLQLPWDAGVDFRLPEKFIGGIWVSLVLGITFTAAYVFRVAQEAARMSAALAATQLVLSREQRLAELGSLAAAAAHELGTPLGTIAVAARELERTLPRDGVAGEDVRLIRSQADRCRDILARLAHHDDDAAPHRQLPLGALLDEIAAPNREIGVRVDVRLSGSGDEPTVLRRPDLMHSLTSIVENAADFANTHVEIVARWDAAEIAIEVLDDGPGFPLDVLQRLGEPYITTRPGRTAPRDTELGPSHVERHVGMGLGFFISKTLIERAGGRVSAGNRPMPQAGASVVCVWPRAVLDPNVKMQQPV